MSSGSTALTSARARLSAGRCDPVHAPPHSETPPAEELERDRERGRLSALDAQVARETRRGQKARGASLHFEPQLLRPAAGGVGGRAPTAKDASRDTVRVATIES